MAKKEVNITLDAKLLQKAAEKIAALTGLHFPPDKQDELGKKLFRVAKQLNVNDYTLFLNQFIQDTLSGSILSLIINELTVNETFFMREKQSLEMLRHEILPDILKRKPADPVYIWSAACSSGEEVYSLKIILHEYFPAEIVRRIHIIGTDIDPHVLQKAREGVYGKWSFRGVPAPIIRHYFTQSSDGKSYRIKDFLKQNVEFKSINLVNKADYVKLNLYTPLDLILCRNVFIYFSERVTQKIGHSFYHLLGEQGWLLTSMAEATWGNFPLFHSVHFPGVIVFQKNGVSQSSSKTRIPDHNLSRTGLSPKNNRSVSHAVKRKSIPRKKSEKGGQSNIDSVHGLISNALEALKLGEYSKAAELYKEIEKFPEKRTLSPEIQSLLLTIEGNLLLNTGHYEAAEAAIEKALEYNPINDRALYMKAMLLIEQNEVETALKTLDKIIFLDHSHLMSFYMKAVLLRNGKQKENNSVKALQTVIQLLDSLPENDIVPYSDGLSVSGLKNHIHHLLEEGTP